ncbi:MAG: hypothetical protein M0R22_07525, partial [Dehalococcoidia bacterium]|nr:hypothetical protein [Dehalococcoidia bacterium]
MRLLTGAEMHDVYEVAALANELAAGYDYLLDAMQAAEPHALADVAALREENERLRARIAELEPATANWALVSGAQEPLVMQFSPAAGWVAYARAGWAQ